MQYFRKIISKLINLFHKNILFCIFINQFITFLTQLSYWKIPKVTNFWNEAIKSSAHKQIGIIPSKETDFPHKSTKHRAELKLSRHLPVICTVLEHFPDLHLAVFFFNWKWNFGTSELASSKGKTKQRFVNMPSAVIDLSRDENHKRKNEMDSLSFEGFRAQLDCKLTTVTK